jgi:hypothetical protein
MKKDFVICLTKRIAIELKKRTGNPKFFREALEMPFFHRLNRAKS